MIFGFFKRKKEEPKGARIGEVVHYFPHVEATVIKLSDGTLSVGDTIRIKGHTTDFEQRIQSMQIEHQTVEQVSKDQEVAIKVKKKTRRGDVVFKLNA